jgi:phage terminase small subunit
MIDNPRHERFAQALAAGKPASVAYVEAGYKANDGNASTLKGNQRVLDRVAELQSRIVESVVLTREWVIEELIDNLKRAKTGDKLELSAANRAAELLGKELGMFVERSEVKISEFEELTTEQKRERVLGRVRQLGIDRIGPVSGTA